MEKKERIALAFSEHRWGHWVLGFCSFRHLLDRFFGFGIHCSFRFSLFDIRVLVLINKKSGYSVQVVSNWSTMSEVSEFITKVSPSYETETMEEVIALVEHCKNFLPANAHQIGAASGITEALNGPQGQYYAVVLRVKGLKITNLQF